MSKKAAKTVQMFIVQSKLRDLIKRQKMKCSSEVMPAFNRMIADYVCKAVERAKANGRKTLRAADL